MFRTLLPGLGPMEWTVLLILGLLLFGRRLPDVGHYLGKGLMEFKKRGRRLELLPRPEERRGTGFVLFLLACYLIVLTVVAIALRWSGS